jgi:hypothetical protein
VIGWQSLMIRNSRPMKSTLFCWSAHIPIYRTGCLLFQAKNSIQPGGHVAIIDFKKKNPFGPALEERVM